MCIINLVEYLAIIDILLKIYHLLQVGLEPKKAICEASNELYLFLSGAKMKQKSLDEQGKRIVLNFSILMHYSENNAQLSFISNDATSHMYRCSQGTLNFNGKF